jgi:hypothetical protein
MLSITISGQEFFDSSTKKFLRTEPVVIELEHSLAALSKWESKYQKPFLSGKPKELDEIMGYFRFMVITPGVDLEILSKMSQANIDEIDAYINSKETATTFSMLPQRRGRSDVVTAEVIYHWMVAFNIPPEWEHRHLNQLFTFIRVCNAKNPNSKQKKMSKSEMMAQRRELNARRRQEHNTRG